MTVATRSRLPAGPPRAGRRNGNLLIGIAAVLLALLAARALVLLVSAQAAVPASSAPLPGGSGSAASAPPNSSPPFPMGAPGAGTAPKAASPGIAPISSGLSSPGLASRPASRAASPPDTDDDGPAVDPHLIAEVARRQAVLDRREQALTTRAAQVDAADKLARREIAELTGLRTQLEKLLGTAQKGADADLAVLVGLYRNMKPQQAAVVMNKLAPGSAAAILEQLDTREAGPIVAAMDPNAALALTEALEQRRAAFRR